MKMKRLSVAAAFLATIILPFAAAASSLMAGEYLEDQFIAVLTATRSPYQAIVKGAADGVPQSVRVAYRRHGQEFQANWNWHEGALLFTAHQNGTIDEGEAWTSLGFKSPGVLTEDDPRHFRLHAGRWTRGYTFVGDADKAISRLALVGRYQDQEGRRYTFRSDGVIHGPGIAGHFKLDNDHVVDPYDFFLTGAEYKTPIGFKWANGTLTLIPMRPPGEGVPSVGIPDYEHPIAVLHPMEGSESAPGLIAPE